MRVDGFNLIIVGRTAGNKVLTSNYFRRMIWGMRVHGFNLIIVGRTAGNSLNRVLTSNYFRRTNSLIRWICKKKRTENNVFNE